MSSAVFKNTGAPLRAEDYTQIVFIDHRRGNGSTDTPEFIEPPPVEIQVFISWYDLDTPFEFKGLSARIIGEVYLKRKEGGLTKLPIVLNGRGLVYETNNVRILYVLKNPQMSDRIKTLLTDPMNRCR